MNTFQQRLHNLRIEHGYSLESLANELNKRFDASFNKGMLSKYESGKTIPDFKNIPLLAEIFGVSVDYLIGVSDNPARYNNDVPILDAPEQETIPSLEQQYSPEDVAKAIRLYERYRQSLPPIREAVEGLLKSGPTDS